MALLGTCCEWHYLEHAANGIAEWYINYLTNIEKQIYIFYDTFFWIKWRMVPSHVFFLRYSTDRRWRPKLHRDACFTIDRYVHLSCFRCRPFIGVRRKAGNAAPVSLHHQTPAGTAGSGKVLVDSGQHASTDSPHLVMYRPWNCDWRKGDGVQKLAELQTRSLGRLGFIDHR
jgi:hypothetical protein